MNKNDIARVFYEIAELMEIQDMNKFKVNAYKKAARNISSTDWDIMDLYENDKLSDIPGVGKSTEEKIREIINTGTCQYLQELKESIPEGLKEMYKIKGVGQKALMKIWKQKGIKTVDQLEKACTDGQLRELEGFGEKTEQNIIESIQYMRKFKDRYRIDEAQQVSQELLQYLEPYTDTIKVVGSLRRYKETIGDVDILTTGDSQKIMEAVRSYPYTEKVLASGSTKTSIMMGNGLQLDVRVVDPSSWGAAIQYFTGSKEHNIKVRRVAQNKGMTLNEYRLATDDDERVAGKEEQDIYEALDLPFVPPELREPDHELSIPPNLVREVAGDLHIHSNYSDGNSTIEDLAQKAKKMGYKYIGIADHLRGFGDGLNQHKVYERLDEMKQVEESSGMQIIDAVEVDIMSDGTLYKPELAEEREYIIGAIHNKIDDSNIMARLEYAFSNYNIDALAHPTGRVIGEREGNTTLDMELLSELCLKYDVALEINSLPQRLDLRYEHLRQLDPNVNIEIGTDSHGTSMMDFMEYGVMMARKGLVTRGRVVNASIHD